MPEVVNTYTYDDANRINTLNAVSYTWDGNGNLLNDGVNTYTYNHANQLTAVSASGLTVGYAYNGLGDRLRQFENGVTTHYTLDLNASVEYAFWTLTQVLADGARTYLYGNCRLEQESAASTEYFIGDALGSVRQLVDEAGDVRLNRSYEPYGEALSNECKAETEYAFTGEKGEPGASE